MNKRGLGELPKSKSKTHEKFKTKVLFFLCFLLFFASVYTLAMLATVEGAVPGPMSDKTDTVSRQRRLVANFQEVKDEKSKKRTQYTCFIYGYRS